MSPSVQYYTGFRLHTVQIFKLRKFLTQDLHSMQLVMNACRSCQLSFTFTTPPLLKIKHEVSIHKVHNNARDQSIRQVKHTCQFTWANLQ